MLAALPAGAHLVVSSSMPVRDLEWYARPRADVTVHANRGANGIDGVLSTAIGVALATGAPTACLLGDVAFLHDSNALLGIADRGIDLTAVVVDNDGGGIFSFLPQAAALPVGAASSSSSARPTASGPSTSPPPTASPRSPSSPPTAWPRPIAATAAAGGVHVVVVRTDRAANVKLHAELHAAVAAAVSAA